MITPAIVLGAFGAIFIALVGAMVISAIPDPNREIINALPNTTPDIKTPANQVLDAKDSMDNAIDTMSLVKKLMPLVVGIGIPSGVIVGLLFGRR